MAAVAVVGNEDDDVTKVRSPNVVPVVAVVVEVVEEDGR